MRARGETGLSKPDSEIKVWALPGSDEQYHPRAFTVPPGRLHVVIDLPARADDLHPLPEIPDESLNQIIPVSRILRYHSPNLHADVIIPFPDSPGDDRSCRKRYRDDPISITIHDAEHRDPEVGSNMTTDSRCIVSDADDPPGARSDFIV